MTKTITTYQAILIESDLVSTETSWRAMSGQEMAELAKIIDSLSLDEIKDGHIAAAVAGWYLGKGFH